MIFLLPITLYQSYLIPKIHRWSTGERSKVDLLTKVGSKLSIMIGIVIGIPMVFISPFVTSLIFGDEYKLAGIFYKFFSSRCSFKTTFQ